MPIPLLFVGALIVQIELNRRGMMPRLTTYDPIMWMGLFVVCFHWFQWRERSLRRRAEACGYLLCDDCTYDLRGVETGVCPECGEAFTAGTLKERWTEGPSSKK